MISSQIIPTMRVNSVIGTPARIYSRKLMGCSLRTFSTTIIFATEPVIVRLPASVLVMASNIQNTCELPYCGARFFQIPV